MVKITDQNTLARILAQIDTLRKVTEDGLVSYTSLLFSEYVAIIAEYLGFDEAIPDDEKTKIVSAVLFGHRENNFPLKLFEEKVKKLEKEFLGKEKVRYCIVTSVSISPTCKIGNFKFQDSYFMLSGKGHSKFKIERKKIYESVKRSIVGKYPDEYSAMRIYSYGRTPSEGFDKAFYNFDLLRGMWNFYFNRVHSMRTSFGRTQPVNKVAHGPLHTVHYTNGRLAISDWWYDANYKDGIALISAPKDVHAMGRMVKSFSQKLKNHTYKKSIFDILVRYCQALDSPNMAFAFLQLWGVLETLTSSERSSYTDIIRRATFLFNDRQYSKDILSYLRDCRNSSVHHGKPSISEESNVYMLKNFVEALIEFHTINKLKFKSIGEAASFLDLPSDKDSLVRKLKWAKTAYRMHKYAK